MTNAIRHLTQWLVFLMLVVMATSDATSQSAGWERTSGPAGGRIRAMTTSPDGTLFAATDRGVFRSVDGGAGWLDVNKGIEGVTVSALVAGGGSVVFAGTFSSGIFESSDNGDSWSSSPGSPVLQINELALDGDIVYAGTSSGVYRTGDGWFRSGLGQQFINAIVFGEGRIFAASFTGVYENVDGSWQQNNAGLTNTLALALTVDEAGVVLAGTFDGVFRWSAGVWESASQGLTNTVVRSLTVGVGNILFAGTDDGVFASGDTGKSWVRAGDGITDGEVNKLASDNRGSVFAGTRRGGIFVSTDDGVSWEPTNLIAIGTQSIAFGGGDTIFAGTGGGGVYRTTDAGASWAQINNGLQQGLISAVAVSPSRTVFAASSDVEVSGIFRSIDNGDSWQRTLFDETQAIAIHSDGVVYAASSVLQRSSDDGKTWDAFDLPIEGGGGTTVVVDDGGTVFVGTDGSGVLRSETGGESWTSVNKGLPDFLITSLGIGPDGVMLVGMVEGGVFRSTDRGDNWIDANNGLSVSEITQISFNGSGVAFAGTRFGGVFRSLDLGSSWTPYSSGLTDEWVLAIGSTDRGDLFAGTQRNGVFRLANVPPTIDPVGAIEVNEGARRVVTISGSDQDGDVITFLTIGLPSFSTFVDNGDGTASLTLLPGFEDAGTYQAGITARDQLSGQTTDAMLSISVVNVNRRPSLAQIGDVTLREGETTSVPIVASDPDLNDVIELTLSLAPSFASLMDNGDGTGRINLNPGFDDAGIHDIDIVATDAGGLEGFTFFSLTVTDVNRAPVLSTIADRSVAEGGTLTVPITATDPDGDTVSLVATALPPFGDMVDNGNGTGEVTLKPDFGDVGQYLIEVEARDTRGGTAQAEFLATVVNTNRAPVVVAPGAQANAEGNLVSLQIDASDPDENILSCTATGLPPNLTISTDGLISGSVSFSAADGSPYDVEVVCTDPGLLSASVSFTWSVVNVNRAPQITAPGAQASSEGDFVSLQIDASDPDENILSCTATGLPPNLTISTDGLISGSVSFSAADGSPYDVEVVCTDPGLLSASVSFTWSVVNVNRAPQITAPGAQASSEGDFVSLQIDALDPDEDILSFTATGLPPNLTISTEGLISGSISFTAADDGLPYDVDVVCTDPGLLSTSVFFTWSIENVQAVTAVLENAAVAGSQVGVVATLAAGIAPVEQDVFFRRLGETVYQASPLIEEARATYRGSIPAEFVAASGLEYYIRFFDGDVAYTLPEFDPISAPIRVGVSIPQTTAGISSGSGQYRMVSVPMALADPSPQAVFEDDFGEYDVALWRLLRWNASSQAYDEFPDLGSGLLPARAFWLITAEDQAFDVESGTSLGAEEPAIIRLDPGWSQIGDPYGFDVTWSSIDPNALVESPVAFEDGEYEYNQLLLSPWEGYFVYNPQPEAVVLPVPPVRASNASAKATRGSIAGRDPAYAIQLVASLAGTHLRDTQNYAALAASALVGRDGLDFAEAPPVGAHVQLSIIEGSERLAGNFKPVDPAGQFWDFEVGSHLPHERIRTRKSVTIGLIEHGERPSDFELGILDRDNRIAIPVLGNAFQVEITAQHPVRRFRLVLGTTSFAEANNEGIALETTFDVLGGGYPNPFSGKTNISFQLATSRLAALEIFDILGRRVRLILASELRAGRHSVAWDGRDDNGFSVASGLYFVRLRAGDFVATKQLLLVR